MSYQIIGNDGRTYGPATAEQIREWVAQGRAVRQTPVLSAGASCWSVLGLLPEFAPLFASPPPIAPSAPPPPPARPSGPLPTSSFATAGLVFGILSLLCCCCCGGFPFNLLGLIFSLIALVQISEHPERYAGRPQAIVGIVLSAASFLFFLASIASNNSQFFINTHNF